MMPFYTNHCAHPPDHFHATLDLDGDKVDVYRYTSGPLGRCICLRYGNDPTDHSTWTETLDMPDTIQAVFLRAWGGLQ